MTEQFRVESTSTNAGILDAIRDAVENADGTEAFQSADESNTDGIGTVVGEIALIVTVGPSAALWVADMFYRIRQRFRPMMIIDFTHPTPVITVHEDVPGMRGQIILRHPDGEEVKIESPDSSAELAASVLKGFAGLDK